MKKSKKEKKKNKLFKKVIFWRDIKYKFDKILKKKKDNQTI